MKNETEIIESIISFIKPDKNIKSAVLNGSRANPNAPKDFMQDYDIALFVDCLDEAQKYKNDQSWIYTFGNVVIVQQNDFDDNTFIFLVQYSDSVRLDLSFHDVKSIYKDIEDDSLSVVIYDRDNIIKHISEPNENTYFVQKPTKNEWNETLNDLWWLQVYIAKELWRNEIPLAKELYDVDLLDYLRDLISWHIAIDMNWEVNVGHGGKWFKRLLPQEIYDNYIYFYSSANRDEQWEKLLNIGAFIRKIALPLSEKLGYEYPAVYDANVSNYIRRLYELPTNATSL